MAPRRNALAVLVALAGSGLIISAAMSLFAAFAAFPSQATVATLRARKGVAPEAAAAAARASLRAADWFDEGRHLTEAALARAAARTRMPGLPTPAALAERALAAQPASPYNWTRLAAARRDSGDLTGAIRAWEMSVLTGRYAPGLMVPRLAVGFELLSVAGAEQVALLGDQIRLVATRDAEALAVAARDARTEPFVRAALAPRPDLLSDFNDAHNGARG